MSEVIRKWFKIMIFFFFVYQETLGIRDRTGTMCPPRDTASHSA